MEAIYIFINIWLSPNSIFVRVLQTIRIKLKMFSCSGVWSEVWWFFVSNILYNSAFMLTKQFADRLLMTAYGRLYNFCFFLSKSGTRSEQPVACRVFLSNLADHYSTKHDQTHSFRYMYEFPKRISSLHSRTRMDCCLVLLFSNRWHFRHI